MAYQYTDIVVVGGGMVGGALALGLAQQKMTVAVIEQTEPPEFNPMYPPGKRISSISSSSIDILRGLGIWENILSMRAHPYRHLEAWTWENAYVTFDAAEMKLPLLGYMIENHILKLALWQALKKRSEVTLHVSVSLKTLCRKNNQQLLLTLNNGKKIATKLVVGADGANSQVRKIAGIGTHVWQYRQFCMLVIIKCDKESGDNTWQHFTSSGPRAFLPLFGHWASIVWYDTPARIRQLYEMSMIELQHEINKYFPAKLGRVTPISTSIFPLIRHHARKYFLEGIVLVGDAAHTIHPLIGQGVNLGYRDVAALLEVLADANSYGEKWTNEKVLKRYQIRRRIDNLIMQFGADLFHTGFNHTCGMMKLTFNAGLMMVERTNILKRYVMRYALGL